MSIFLGCLNKFWLILSKDSLEVPKSSPDSLVGLSLSDVLTGEQGSVCYTRCRRKQENTVWSHVLPNWVCQTPIERSNFVSEQSRDSRVAAPTTGLVSWSKEVLPNARLKRLQFSRWKFRPWTLESKAWINKEITTFKLDRISPSERCCEPQKSCPWNLKNIP